MNLEINDKNSMYIGDGAYAHKDKGGRLWVFTYDGENVSFVVTELIWNMANQICLESDVFESLVRFYENRIHGPAQEGK